MAEVSVESLQDLMQRLSGQTGVRDLSTAPAA
jgi:hypothetical protein